MSDRPLRIVVALGGNAICPAGSEGSIPQQFAQTRVTVRHLADLMDRGHRVLVTHGNGPQVGNILRRVEIASSQVYPVDLGLCVADTQAGMGYMICQSMINEFRKRGQERQACTIVTTVLVDPNDPAFADPTKPIGPFLTPDEAQRHQRDDGWQMVEVPGRGMRRVVPSPKPLRIQELDVIQRLYEAGLGVVAVGGGGIPVIDRPDGGNEGVEAVIDKDLSAAILATAIDADLLAILTDQPGVFQDFGKPTQKALDRLTVSEARRRFEAGEFPAGSMGPKIEAAINFVTGSTQSQPRALITSCDRIVDALDDGRGTWVVPDSE
ncbi:MAG: carbamate kinase [bacterium]|nr:carbamate kinase [bacterium]